MFVFLASTPRHSMLVQSLCILMQHSSAANARDHIPVGQLVKGHEALVEGTGGRLLLVEILVLLSCTKV